MHCVTVEAGCRLELGRGPLVRALPRGLSTRLVGLPHDVVAGLQAQVSQEELGSHVASMAQPRKPQGFAPPVATNLPRFVGKENRAHPSVGRMSKSQVCGRCYCGRHTLLYPDWRKQAFVAGRGAALGKVFWEKRAAPLHGASLTPSILR